MTTNRVDSTVASGATGPPLARSAASVSDARVTDGTVRTSAATDGDSRHVAASPPSGRTVR